MCIRSMTDVASQRQQIGQFQSEKLDGPWQNGRKLFSWLVQANIMQPAVEILYESGTHYRGDSTRCCHRTHVESPHSDQSPLHHSLPLWVIELTSGRLFSRDKVLYQVHTRGWLACGPRVAGGFAPFLVPSNRPKCRTSFFQLRLNCGGQLYSRRLHSTRNLPEAFDISTILLTAINITRYFYLIRNVDGRSIPLRAAGWPCSKSSVGEQLVIQ